MVLVFNPVHLIDICFLLIICLWHISKIQFCLRVVVGPEFVLTLTAFMRSSACHAACPHGRLAQKWGSSQIPYVGFVVRSPCISIVRAIMYSPCL